MDSVFDLDCENKSLQECKEIVKTLKKQSFVNQLTKLKNREALMRDLKTQSYSLLALIDIDKLRFINDLYGISVGNEVIKQCANFLENRSDKYGYALYQTSGDEFVICTNNNKIGMFKEFIYTLCKDTTDLHLFIEEISQEISIDLTIGTTYELSEMALLGMSFDSRLLLVQADTALHHAKANKKKLVEYDESLNTLQDMQNILEWKEKIQKALYSDSIIPVFQPIVDKDGKITKYETLMRLRDDEKLTLISPYAFLEISILTKQYANLSRQMITKALYALVNSNENLSINLTYSDLQDDEIITLLKETLEDYDVGNRLIIEIVESEFVREHSILQTFIDKFKPYGVQIAIDDFGTGFSNFINIIQMKPDILKIDGSLVKNIDKDHDSYLFVKAITGVAHELGIKVVAEFVHSLAVFDTLKEIGIDEYQGFYFYEPAEEFVGVMAL